MSPRIKKGLQWTKSVLFFVSILAGVKVIYAFGTPDPGKSLATALMLFLGWCIFLCPLAFILGWITGSKEKAKIEALPNVESEVMASINPASSEIPSEPSSHQFCSKCGFKLSTQSIFCSSCGTKIS